MLPFWSFTEVCEMVFAGLSKWGGGTWRTDPPHRDGDDDGGESPVSPPGGWWGDDWIVWVVLFLAGLAAAALFA